MKSKSTKKEFKALTVRIPIALHKPIRNALMQRDQTVQEFVLKQLVDILNFPQIKDENLEIERCQL